MAADRESNFYNDNFTCSCMKNADRGNRRFWGGVFLFAFLLLFVLASYTDVSFVAENVRDREAVQASSQGSASPLLTDFSKPQGESALALLSFGRGTGGLVSSTGDDNTNKLPIATFPGAVYKPIISLEATGQKVTADVLVGDLRRSAEKIYHYKVENGDTLTSIFDGLSVYSLLLPLLRKETKIIRILSYIKPGEELEIGANADGLVYILYVKEPQSHLLLFKDRHGGEAHKRDKNGVFYKLVALPLVVRYREILAGNIIEDNLYFSAKQAGLQDNLIAEMANLLGWDIDFSHDIRPGASFFVVHREKYAGKKKLPNSDILGVRFILSPNRSVNILRYEDSSGKVGFYTPEGRDIRKRFLRQPIAPGAAYVSSRFNLKRKHPVLHTLRAHRGVDFSASIGTRILATGSGKLVYRGRHGGYGKTVIIRHGGGYSTLYAHMSGYASPKLGQRINQGDVIGYVGSTGLSTGPHVHYEFRINGVHKNPQTVGLPKAMSLPKSEHRAFYEQTEWVQAHLNRKASSLVEAYRQVAMRGGG